MNLLGKTETQTANCKSNPNQYHNFNPNLDLAQVVSAMEKFDADKSGELNVGEFLTMVPRPPLLKKRNLTFTMVPWHPPE